jgi:hypothetical protein
MTSYTVYNEVPMFLATSISKTQTTGITLAAPQLNGANHMFAALNGGILRIQQGSLREDIYYATATVNATTFVVTLATGVIRNVDPANAKTIVTAGTGQAFSKGASVELTVDARLLNLAAKTDSVNTFAAKQTFSVPFAGPTYATFAALPVGGNGDQGAYVTADGLVYDYIAGGWSARASGTTPLASTTVAGKFEEATVAEQGTATATGGTGARLIPAVANLISASAGATDASKLAVLGATGKFSATFLDLGSTGDGSDGVLTISSPTTLTRDMYCSTLIVNSTLTTAGYRIFCNGTTSGTSSIIHTGNTGTVGGAAAGQTAGTGGAGGTALTAGYFPESTAGTIGAAGGTGAGGSGSGNPGTVGTVGSNTANCTVATVGASSGAGGRGSDGNGGGGGGAAGAAGTGGTPTTLKTNTHNFDGVRFWYTFNVGTITGPVASVAGAGGAGGGGGGNTGGAGVGGGGGGGGGSGSTGGFVFLATAAITGAVSLNATGGIGGAGGAGGNGSSNGGGGGGGGGGAGGGGGVAILAYTSSSGWTGTVTAPGGAGGAAGANGTPNNASTQTTAAAGATGITGLALTFTI